MEAAMGVAVKVAAGGGKRWRLRWRRSCSGRWNCRWTSYVRRPWFEKCGGGACGGGDGGGGIGRSGGNSMYMDGGGRGGNGGGGRGGNGDGNGEGGGGCGGPWRQKPASEPAKHYAPPPTTHTHATHSHSVGGGMHMVAEEAEAVEAALARAVDAAVKQALANAWAPAKSGASVRGLNGAGRGGSEGRLPSISRRRVELALSSPVAVGP